MSKYFMLPLCLFLFTSFITPSLAGEVSLPRTGQTTSYAPGDDGAIQAGLVWPSPRFKDNGDGTLTDNLTGLMWMKDADSLTSSGYVSGYAPPVLQSWKQSFDFVDQLNSGALSNITGYTAHYTDWRVPNVNEMESFLKADSPQYTWLNQAGFVNFRQDTAYYTSTTLAGDTTQAWVVRMNCGMIFSVSKGDTSMHVEPVRGISNGPAKVWQTGQTQVYNPGDDGDNAIHGYGTAWDHSTRFIDNTDGTVTDTLTGLMWPKQSGSPGQAWADALTYVNSLNTSNYLGHSDWRLPNRKELRSVIDYSQSNPPLPAGNPLSFPAQIYWSSSRDIVHDNQFWYVAMDNGNEQPGPNGPAYLYAVWPVRGGVNNAPPASKYTLTINKAGDGAGTVTSSPSGINCGASSSTAQASFDANTVVALTAAPSSGSIFNGWSGGASGSSSPINITMTSNKTITASFSKSSYSLTTSANPAAGGTVTLSAPGPYAPNAQVTLTPNPATGYQFSGWSGDASGTLNPLTVTMNKDKTITANFTVIPDTLSLDYAQNGKTVTLNASLKMNGTMTPGQRVQFFETVAGKNMPCGKAVTGSDGTCRRKAIFTPGTHIWYARAGQEVSSPVSCTIGKTTAISPVNKAVVTVPDPDLSWLGYDNAVGYEVQVSNRPGFPAAYTTTFHATGTTFNAEALSLGKRYFWRVIVDLPAGTSMPSVARSLVYKNATNLSLTRTSANGNRGTFQAALTDPNGNGIPGKRVKIAGKTLAYGLTGSGGLLTRTVTLPLGAYSVTAAFAGDGTYAPSVSLPASGTNP